MSSFFPGLTDREANALVNTARAAGTEPQWLYELINLESGHNPKAANPRSSAKGLIQFMDATARAMGYASSAALVAAYPDYISQMEGPVKDYFTRLPPVKAPYRTRQALYMKVFFPLAMNVPPQTTFESIYLANPKSTGGAEGYKKFAKGNPGIITVNDYVNKTLQRAMRKTPSTRMAGVGIGGALVLAGSFFLARSRGWL